MANHKWKELPEHEVGTKPHKCIVCGIQKKWMGGDYQSWSYSWYEIGKSEGGGIYRERKTSFKRPECNKDSKSQQQLNH